MQTQTEDCCGHGQTRVQEPGPCFPGPAPRRPVMLRGTRKPRRSLVAGTPWDGPGKAQDGRQPLRVGPAEGRACADRPRLARPPRLCTRQDGKPCPGAPSYPTGSSAFWKLLEAQPSHVRAGAGEGGRACLQSSPMGQQEELETFPHGHRAQRPTPLPPGWARTRPTHAAQEGDRSRQTEERGPMLEEMLGWKRGG